jgi:hypothetical protein
MTYTVEVLLRETDRVVSETVTREEDSPAGWSEADVIGVLEGMLQAVARAKDPGDSDPTVALRGLSWIVNSVPTGVVIAIEIPSGAVVAGPFAIPQDRLHAMVGSVLSRSAMGAPSSPAPGRVH